MAAVNAMCLSLIRAGVAAADDVYVILAAWTNELNCTACGNPRGRDGLTSESRARDERAEGQDGPAGPNRRARHNALGMI